MKPSTSTNLAVQPGGQASVSNESSLVSAKIDKLSDEFTALRASFGDVRVDAKGIEAQLRDAITSVSVSAVGASLTADEVKGVEARIATTMSDVLTSVVVSVNSRITGVETQIRSDFRNEMMTQMGIVGNDLKAFTSATVQGQLSLWEDRLTAHAGRDVDQSRNKYGGLVTAGVCLIAIFAVIYAFRVSRKATNLERQLRSIQRGLLTQGWTAPPLGPRSRGPHPNDTLDERSARLYNWELFAPSVVSWERTARTDLEAGEEPRA